MENKPIFMAGCLVAKERLVDGAERRDEVLSSTKRQNKKRIRDQAAHNYSSKAVAMSSTDRQNTKGMRSQERQKKQSFECTSPRPIIISGGSPTPTAETWGTREQGSSPVATPNSRICLPSWEPGVVNVRRVHFVATEPLLGTVWVRLGGRRIDPNLGIHNMVEFCLLGASLSCSLFFSAGASGASDRLNCIGRGCMENEETKPRWAGLLLGTGSIVLYTIQKKKKKIDL